TITIATYAINYSFKIPGNEQYKLRSSDGSFSIQLPNIKEPFYCTIKSNKWQDLQLSDLLIEPGDSLYIEAETSLNNAVTTNRIEHLKISGRNAYKNQIQYYLALTYRFKSTLPGAKPIIVNRFNNLKDGYTDIERNYILRKAYLDSLLAVPEASISNKLRNELQLQLALNNATSLLSIYNIIKEKQLKKNTPLKEKEQLLADYYTLVDSAAKTIISAYNTKYMNPKFIEFACRKIIIDTRIKQKGNGRISGLEYLKELNKWPTSCKEEIATLLAYWFATSGQTDVSDMPAMFKALMQIVKKPQLNKIIEKFVSIYTPEEQVYPFELTGVDGQKVSIRNFMDKIVVLDFWFTGCVACIQMANMLKIVKDSLHNNKDIVFMSINTDEDKNKWLQSVETEKYTHKGFINLYTNGEGPDHPLITHYNITAYPRVFVIGKNNIVFSLKPFEMSSVDYIDRFIALLKEVSK
ncbi:MAG: TlpA family protein disulfide reductase, partial [Sediminibacterium sp.]